MEYEEAREEWLNSEPGRGITLAESAFLAGYRGGLREGIGCAREFAATLEKQISHTHAIAGATS